jgi:hypothetical protein
MGNSLICHCLAFIERIGLVTLFTVFTVTFPARNLFKNLILLFEGDVGLCGTVDAATTDAATMDASSCPFPLTARRVNLLEPDPLLSRSRAQRCGCPLSRLLRFTRAGGRRAQLPPPDWLPFSTMPGSVGGPSVARGWRWFMRLNRSQPRWWCWSRQLSFPLRISPPWCCLCPS